MDLKKGKFNMRRNPQQSYNNNYNNLRPYIIQNSIELVIISLDHIRCDFDMSFPKGEM